MDFRDQVKKLLLVIQRGGLHGVEVHAALETVEGKTSDILPAHLFLVKCSFVLVARAAEVSLPLPVSNEGSH